MLPMRLKRKSVVSARKESEHSLNIIVVGAGKVGLTLAEHLSEEHHSVTVVDVSEDALVQMTRTNPQRLIAS